MERRVVYKIGRTPRTARGTPVYFMMSEAMGIFGVEVGVFEEMGKCLR